MKHFSLLFRNIKEKVGKILIVQKKKHTFASVYVDNTYKHI